MRIRTIVLLLVAVILAGGTAYLARAYLASQRTVAVAPVAQTPARSVLVAKADIPRGKILVPNDLTWQVWPEGPIDKSYILLGGDKKPDAYAGWVARNPLASGEPVTEAKIVAPGNRGFLAAVLQPGMRAITVPVSLTSGLAGFIFPGDYVDLLLTFPVPAAASGDARYAHKATETMMHHVRVIAIDQRLESKAGQVVPGHTATFEVTPKQSEGIALATEVGRMSLTLESLAAHNPQTADNQAADGDKVVAVAANAIPADSTVVVAPDAQLATPRSYTVDSDINPLLPKFRSEKNSGEVGKVTILRGSAKVVEAASASKTAGGTPETPEQPEQQKSGE